MLISLGAAIYLLPLVLERLAAPSRGSAPTGDFISHAERGRTQATGSRDFESIMKSMSWDRTCEADITKNVDVANRASAMLICARVFVLKYLLKNLPVNTDAMVA